MTNDIEGKVRIELDKIIWKAMCGTATQGLMPNDKEALVNEALSSILSLTTKPLDEKEVEKVLEREETEDLEPPYRCLPPIDKKMIEIKSKLICSHFSKQIKYPEKKEVIVSEYKGKPIIMSKERQQEFKEDLGMLIGYNKAISDMKRLNGEGGV